MEKKITNAEDSGDRTERIKKAAPKGRLFNETVPAYRGRKKY